MRRLREGWTRVTVEIQTAHLPIAQAIAATISAQSPDDPPTTMEQVLSGALEEGMIAEEKLYLGTSSLDYSIREWDQRKLPETTPMMLALVAAVGGRS